MRFLALLLCFFTPTLSFAIDLAIAQLNSYGAKPHLALTDEELAINDLLALRLREADTQDRLHFIKRDKVVRSVLEAAKLTLDTHDALLLYGYLIKENERYLIEVRLYDAQNGDHPKTFFAAASHQDFNELSLDIAEKIVTYLYQLFNITSTYPRLADGLSLTFNVGYGSPLTYTNRLVGLFNLDTTLNFKFMAVPYRRPYLYPYATTALGYQLASNSSLYYSTYHHQFSWDLGLGLGLEWQQKHLLLTSFNASIGLTYDVIGRMYNSSLHYFSAAPGLALRLGYQYWLNDHLAVGLDNRLGLLFYTTPYLSYHIFLNATIYLKKINTKEVL